MENKTPLQFFSTVEKELHETYGENPPTIAEISKYIKTKKFPTNDAGLIITIIGTIITGWAFFRQETINKQNKRLAFSNNPPKCPIENCELSATKFDYNTQEYSCANGHKWK